ncbi:ribokinase [Thermanaerovibrio velox]|uniref:ribokinase n=1 Tax=Thermanaerovibrio velox TaxID=108007 RepID=UPI001FE20D55|nr:ribokinase [Thermanaerovibrio velox]
MISLARIVVVGSLNMDMIMRAERMPMKGETLTGGTFSTAEGGKGGNQAVACSRMGAKVTMMGKVGQDQFGDLLLDSLLREGIEARVLRSSIHTGVAQITVFQDDNAIIVAPGANRDLHPEDLDLGCFTGADGAIFQMEIPIETVEAGLKGAKERGCTTFLNPSPIRPIGEEALSNCDYMVLNHVELRQLTGEDQPDAGIRKLLALGVRGVVLTMGSKGASFAYQERLGTMGAPKINVVDSTGAGDAFMGAFAVMICEGSPMEEAVKAGIAAGSLACLREGAQPSMPYREQVFRSMASM